MDFCHFYLLRHYIGTNLGPYLLKIRNTLILVLLGKFLLDTDSLLKSSLKLCLVKVKHEINI